MQSRLLYLVLSVFVPPLSVFLWLGSRPSTKINLFVWAVGGFVFFKLSFIVGILILLSSLLHSIWLIIFNDSAGGLKNGFSVGGGVSEFHRTKLFLHFTLVLVVLIVVGVTFQREASREKLSDLDELSIENGRLQFESCQLCHRLTRDDHVGPHLIDIIGRRAGGVNGYKYSKSLEAATFSWTDENMIEFLQNPQGFLPGTRMAISPLSKKEATDLVTYLKSRR